MKLGSCSFINDNDQVCAKTFNLYTILFRDPEHPHIIELTELCKWHYDSLTDDHIQRTRQIQMKIANLISDNAKRKQIAKQMDSYYDGSLMQQKIDDFREILKTITIGECKNYLCNKDISKIDQYQKVFTVITFKPSNKKGFIFYFCSKKCFNTFRARCGLLSPIQKGQLTLEVI